ncbi:unnamed protein product [Phaedon cochleariae]|uniref:Uncharacterized protein n=1 Tax=Phaedon cochleariae TaxID=80249 RepID=A0A9N9WXH1_PHACE|nr:unnamed protein product [Phaedon cochleariae]
MSTKKGCMKCPSKVDPSTTRRTSQSQPPPSSSRSRGPGCAVKCAPKSGANSPLPPQYFPTTPGETPQWPPMRQSFPREVQQFQYNENFFDPNRPAMQSRNLVTGGTSMRLSRNSQPRMSVEQPIAEYPPSSIPRPYSGQTVRPTTAQAPQRVLPPQRAEPPRYSGIPQRIPTPRPLTPRAPTTPQVRPTGAIRKVPGVAMRIPVRTPDTPSIRESQPRRQRPVSAPAPAPSRPVAAPAPQPVAAPSPRPVTSQQVARPQVARPQVAMPQVARSQIPRPQAGPAFDEEDSLQEFERLEEECKREALADIQANRVQVLNVQTTSNQVANIPNAVHLSVIALDGSYATPQASRGAPVGYATSVRELLNHQWKKSRDIWSPENYYSQPSRQSPPRPQTTAEPAFPPENLMNYGFIEDETIDYPASPDLNTGFMQDRPSAPPPSPGLNYGFIEDETIDFPPSPGMNYGFIEDETIDFPDSHELNCGFIGDESMGFPPNQNLDYGFIEDESMEFPGSPGLDYGFIEDESMEIPGSPGLDYGFIEDESMQFPASPGLDYSRIEDESMPDYVMRGQSIDYPSVGSSRSPSSRYDKTLLNSSLCNPDCSGSPYRRG